ncbi:hypothetical protein F4777DRAFT_596923 [Nemania sp. FL0916]|nr:hypothetical protein F4777DRAFT_596923 [Nemania sp. FL0916]
MDIDVSGYVSGDDSDITIRAGRAKRRRRDSNDVEAPDAMQVDSSSHEALDAMQVDEAGETSEGDGNLLAPLLEHMAILDPMHLDSPPPPPPTPAPSPPPPPPPEIPHPQIGSDTAAVFPDLPWNIFGAVSRPPLNEGRVAVLYRCADTPERECSGDREGPFLLPNPVPLGPPAPA